MFVTVSVIVQENKFVVITQPKVFHFDLLGKADNNLKHEIDFITKHNEFLVEHAIKNEGSWLLSKYKHWNDIDKYRKQ